MTQEINKSPPFLIVSPNYEKNVSWGRCKDTPEQLVMLKCPSFRLKLATLQILTGSWDTLGLQVGPEYFCSGTVTVASHKIGPRSPLIQILEQEYVVPSLKVVKATRNYLMEIRVAFSPWSLVKDCSDIVSPSLAERDYRARIPSLVSMCPSIMASTISSLFKWRKICCP